MFSNNTTKDLKHILKKNNEESRIDYIFSNKCDLVDSVKTIKTPLSDHYILQLNTFTKNQDPCYVQKRWKLGYNIINDTKNSLEISTSIKKVVQIFNEEELTNNYDIFKAKLRDFLRYLDLRDPKRRRDLLKQSIESGNTRTAQTERLKASFHSIKNFCQDLNCGDPKALKNLLKDFNKNKSVTAIRNGTGETTEDIDEIVDSFTEYYSNLYGKAAQKPDKIEMQNRIIKHFSKTNNRLIEKAKTYFRSDEFKEKEVRYAIQKLNSHSAPGSDGFTSDLYKRNIDFFAPELTKLFNSTAATEKVPGSFCISNIKMLPKHNSICTVENFRPISLLNTDLKILSDVLASRLKKPLNHLIKKHQFAYLPNRSINTAILLASLAKEKLGRSNCMISIDFSKAFDRLGTDYFLKLLNEIGCPLILTKTIESLYRETKACIEVNGQI